MVDWRDNKWIRAAVGGGFVLYFLSTYTQYPVFTSTIITALLFAFIPELIEKLRIPHKFLWGIPILLVLAGMYENGLGGSGGLTTTTQTPAQKEKNMKLLFVVGALAFIGYQAGWFGKSKGKGRK